MIWIAFLFLIFAVIAGIYCSGLFRTLYQNGIVKQGGRVALSKLTPDQTSAKTEEDVRLIYRCRRWYLFYVLAVALAVIAGIICIILVATHLRTK